MYDIELKLNISFDAKLVIAPLVSIVIFTRPLHTPSLSYMQPVRGAVSYRGLFTADWFGVREKHCSQLKIYDRLRASEQADDSTTRSCHF